MDSLSEATDYHATTESEPFTESSVVASRDQLFLLCFITSIYFGPDLKEERPQKSILQRVAEGLPTYTLGQLTGSHMKIIEVERVYNYVLHKAKKSLRVELPLLRCFLNGNLPRNDLAFTYPQFPHFFSPQLHPHSWFENRYKIIESVIFINNPDTSYISSDDVDRFKRLTGLENLLLDRDVARFPIQEASPGMIFLPSCLNKGEWTSLMAANKSGFALTGSAAMGQVGRGIGLMDIGESDDAYLFRVSLPGVKRDEEEFSCEANNDGRVRIKGVTTTGGRTVYRFTQLFEMQSENLCPPGRFSIIFQLPGPINPRQFSGNFGIDGILEGIVMKQRQSS